MPDQAEPLVSSRVSAKRKCFLVIALRSREITRRLGLPRGLEIRLNRLPSEERDGEKNNRQPQ